MDAKVTTNIEELEAHLNKVFKGMFKSAEVINAGKEASKIIGGHVASLVGGGNDSGYDYNQSGSFHELIQDEARGGEVKGSQNKLTIGMFEITNMNHGVGAMRNAQFQIHRVYDKETHEFTNRSIYLKQENQMPIWILAEFGSKNGGSMSQFNLEYTPRPDKDIIFGPSLGSVGGAGGGSKKGFFMVSEKGLDGLLGPWARYDEHRMHGGMRAGHIFSEGLEQSKEQINQELAEGIQSYLDSI